MAFEMIDKWLEEMKMQNLTEPKGFEIGYVYKFAIWLDQQAAQRKPNRVKKLQERITRQKEVADLMSNIFFNWKQQERFTKEERETMEALQVQWDAIATR